MPKPPCSHKHSDKINTKRQRTAQNSLLVPDHSWHPSLPSLPFLLLWIFHLVDKIKRKKSPRNILINDKFKIWIINGTPGRDYSDHTVGRETWMFPSVLIWIQEMKLNLCRLVQILPGHLSWIKIVLGGHYNSHYSLKPYFIPLNLPYHLAHSSTLLLPQIRVAEISFTLLAYLDFPPNASAHYWCNQPGPALSKCQQLSMDTFNIYYEDYKMQSNTDCLFPSFRFFMAVCK